MAPSPQQSTGTNTYVEVVPLTLHIGAEIRGVDLSKPLPPEQLKEVRDAFLKWKVVFFRGHNLDHAQHIAMARQFGEPTIGHAVVRLAHRHHRGGQPALRVYPARRDDPALWRRYVLDQSRCRLSGCRPRC